MKHLGKILIAAGALALSAMSHAAPVVDWKVTTTGVWSSYTPGPQPGPRGRKRGRDEE